MSYEALWLALQPWLDRANRRWQALRSHLPAIPLGWILLLSLGSVVVYATVVRSLHLVEADHYYLLGPDSYFFHWVAQGIMSGDTPAIGPGATDTYWLHSGLAYPLAYTAMGISSVFNMSSAAALDLAAKIIPVLLGLISTLVLYTAADRIVGRKAGLFSAFAWATIFYAYFIGAAGYIDRDGLSVLLLMIGALVFYHSSNWQLRVGGRNIGWIPGAIAILAVEAILFLEWSSVGVALLLAVVGIYALVRFLVGYSSRIQTEANPMKRVSAALGEINVRVLAAIVVGNIAALGLIAMLNPNQVTVWINLAKGLFSAGGTGGALGGTSVSEMQGLAIGHITAYRFYLIPITLGLFLAWKRHSDGIIFFAAWFLGLFTLSLFAMRLLFFATPAACLLAGTALAFLWEWQGQGALRPIKKVAVALLLLLLVYGSVGTYALGSGSGGLMAPDGDWQDALAYLREDTPTESVIMTHWNYGYWILDLGDRRPLVDNGYYYFDRERNRDIGLAYTTSDPSETADIMAKHGAEYLIFSTTDDNIAQSIISDADLGPAFEGMLEFPPDSMVRRTVNGKFDSGGGLQVVHRSAPNADVVIIQLTDNDPS